MPAGESVQLDYVVPAGSELYISSCGGAATYTPLTSIGLHWDDEQLFVSYGDTLQQLDRSFTGDDTKTLSIILTNQDSVSRQLGGHWTGFLLTEEI